MKHLRIHFLLTCLVFVSLLCGCATAPKATPDLEARLSGAGLAMDAANERSAEFYNQMGPAIEDIKAFCSRPGWLEFEQILLEFPALRDQESQLEITPEMEERLSAWTARWNSSWEETLVAYHALVDKCTILEARRLAARERMLAVQAMYLGAAMMEFSAGRDKQGAEIYAVIEVLEKSATELNSYQIDDLGLYR